MRIIEWSILLRFRGKPENMSILKLLKTLLIYSSIRVMSRRIRTMEFIQTIWKLTKSYNYFFISSSSDLLGAGFLPSLIFTIVYNEEPPRTTNIPATPIAV
mmetsp:Transcript_25478/g.59677  ORF Transcript_25478/g.59677 Transcript_25478/m.59677 type:complete len:101 (-) Transcript_25478:1017-1319(-)